ncbi:choice-of-anchor P family protein [Amycolatopsis dongchuanensis]|uniref:Choice-of-anchor P family protein n=1 Tax=Amycolatopsis dongchuanensis TaxID=1070866 RepID=A0ABP8VC01_9PSEU
MRKGRIGAVAAIAVGVVFLGALPASAAPGEGSAYGAEAGVTLLGQASVQTGRLAPSDSNGTTDATVVGIAVPGILDSGTVGTSAVRDDAGVVAARASTEDLSVGVLGLLGTIRADAVTAQCQGTADGVTGSAQLAGLDLGNLGTVGADAAPNTVVPVRALGITVATITLNEQVKGADDTLTVNALHVKLLGGVLGSLGTGDVVVSSATCGLGAAPVPLASGAGLWAGLALLGVAAVPAAIRVARRRGVLSRTA